VSNVYCPECGFQNPETANYCAKCGTLLRTEESGETTMAFTPGDEEEGGGELEDFGVKGPALVVRSGGGRSGETFVLDGAQTTIGRSPDCDIFLDDVTVSRRHATVSREGGALTIEDLGSLNGTFLNRKRIDKAELSDGDELQVGKYRLTFLR
jgi:pSer/pThr/pTyr-binding forkhead associated (FHA) protein